MEKSKTDEKQHYWLLKTEPGEWSWEDQTSNGGVSKRYGVKNHQALKHLKSFRLNDLCFFYHSGTKSRCVIGVVTVSREWYDDDGGGAVDVKAVGEMRRPVDLKEMKGELKSNKEFGLFKQPRLSVVPVPVENSRSGHLLPHSPHRHVPTVAFHFHHSTHHSDP